MTKKLHATFGAWLRQQIRARGWSVADFDARVGVRPPAAYHWLAGRRAPADDLVARIADILALDPAEVWDVLARNGVTPIGPPREPRPIPAASERPPPADRPFARWLRSELAARGWTAGRLARTLHVEYNTVLRWKGGLQTPASVHVAGLAAALGVDVTTVRDALDPADSGESPS